MFKDIVDKGDMLPLYSVGVGLLLAMLGTAILNLRWRRPEKAAAAPDREFFVDFRLQVLRVVWPVLLAGTVAAALGLATVGAELWSRVHGPSVAHLSLRQRESWQTVLFTQFSHGSLALLVASVVCVWQVFRHVDDLMRERLRLVGIAGSYASNPPQALIVANVIFDTVMTWWARRRKKEPKHPGLSRFTAAHINANAVLDVPRELEKYRNNHPGSVLVQSPWSTLGRLLVLFVYGSSIATLWWCFNQDTAPSAMVNILNWLTLFGIGRYTIVADFAGHGLPESQPSPFMQSWTMSVNIALLVALIVTLTIDLDYAVWAFIVVMVLLAWVLYRLFCALRKSVRQHAHDLLEHYATGLRKGTLVVDPANLRLVPVNRKAE